MLANYQNRNETAKYSYQQPIIEYGSTDTVTVKMIVKVPEKQEVMYMSGFWQVIKFAWVQYFLVWVFWYIVLYRGFFGYLVTSHVFDCKEITDVNLKNLKQFE